MNCSYYIGPFSDITMLEAIASLSNLSQLNLYFKLRQKIKCLLKVYENMTFETCSSVLPVLELGTTFKQYATVLTLQLVILLKVSKCHCVEET